MQVQPPAPSASLRHVVVIVPTRGRKDLLPRALASIGAQRRTPDRVLVVADRAEDLEGIEGGPPFEPLLNERTPGLSGAVNTAVGRLAMECDPEATFVAFLDDDDEWLSGYLQAVCDAAAQGADVAYAGLLRVDEAQAPPRPLSVPAALTVGAFLEGNPHVQGSNLAVRLSSLLRAGGLDEALPSTTDRDLMVRLLELPGIRVAVVQEHLVLHHADHPDRLSAYGSPSKLEGLTRFFLKHQRRMTPQQEAAFVRRASERFGWPGVPGPRLDHPPPPPRPVAAPPSTEQRAPMALVVAFASFDPTRVTARLAELETLADAGVAVTDVVLFADFQAPEAPVSKPQRPFHVHLVTADDARARAREGTYGRAFLSPATWSGIAFARTVCQHQAYQVARAGERAAVWMVDDDLVLDGIFGSDGRRLGSAEFARALEDAAARYDVAVGRVVGAPPVPAAATFRTQLLDLWYDLTSLERTGGLPTAIGDDDDAYYDLREDGTHLETPIRPPASAPAAARVARRVRDIRQGSAPSRRVEPSSRFPSERSDPPVCGGNRFVFALETLIEAPHAMPTSNDRMWRRGDTVWLASLQARGPRSPFRGHYRVGTVGVAVEQVRDAPPQDPVPSLIADILGAAFLRALRREPAALSANAEGTRSQDAAPATFAAEASRRLRQAVLNAWRVQGLADQIMGSPHPAVDAAARHELQALRESFRPEGLIGAFRSIEAHAAAAHDFLGEYDLMARSYSEAEDSLPPPAIRDEAVRWLRTHDPRVTGRVLGHGLEGFVLEAGSRVYKVFHEGARALPSGTLPFLETMGGKSADRIVLPEGVVHEGERVAVRMQRIEGSEYRGGHLSELLEMLREARRLGLVHTNVAPKNLIVAEGRVHLCDVGRSMEPWTDRGFREMAKRTYLTYRWWFRPDLPALLRASRHDEALPELTGFAGFLEAIEVASMEQLSHPVVRRLAAVLPVGTAIDHGAGRCKVAAALAARGWTVDAYDIDTRALPAVPPPGVQVLSPANATFVSQRAYDLAVSNMVLCEVADRDVHEVLSSVRAALAPEGTAIVGVCNPLGSEATSTTGHTKAGPVPYGRPSTYGKTTPYGGSRIERHRPLEWYHRALREHAFHIAGLESTPGVDRSLLAPLPEQLLFHLRPVPTAEEDVTLLILVSPQEWRTVEVQVRHIVGRLVGPHRFAERLVVTDDHPGPYVRAYATPDVAALHEALARLREDGWIDRVVRASPSERLGREWFPGGLAAGARAANGQPTGTFLAGLEACKTRYAFHTDADIMYARSWKHDYLQGLKHLLADDARAVTATLPVPGRSSAPSSTDGHGAPWRVEVRTSLLDLDRLHRLLPLPNCLEGSGWALPWHRAIDRVCAMDRATSWRAPDRGTSFVHVPNAMKARGDDWLNLLRSMELHGPPTAQRGLVDAVADLRAWCRPREEPFVYLVRGRDVPTPLLDRCLRSLEAQQAPAGLLLIDGGSTNGTWDFVANVAAPRWAGRLTVWSSGPDRTPMENIHEAIHRFCPDPATVVVMVDADDQLLPRAMREVAMAYQGGADLTVGSMLRTDKHAAYPVDLKDPRAARGGNVWQHLRTFKAGLFHAIPRERFQMDGAWVPHTEDWAYMVPLVELAKRPVHIAGPTYWYEPRVPKAQRGVAERERIIAHILAQPRCGP